MFDPIALLDKNLYFYQLVNRIVFIQQSCFFFPVVQRFINASVDLKLHLPLPGFFSSSMEKMFEVRPCHHFTIGQHYL